MPPPRPLVQRFLTDLTFGRAVGGIMLLSTTFTLAAAVLIRVVEPDTYDSFGDACWWAVQTVSTVGYGDNPPVTVAGRFIATAVMLFGIALVPAITSLVVAAFFNQQVSARSGSAGTRAGDPPPPAPPAPDRADPGG